MAQARPSMQELIGRRRRAGFVGRSDERAAFRENLDLAPEDERHRFLFHVHGNAGVGKTFLVRELEQIARERGALTAYVDEGVGSVPEAMAAVSREFAGQGHELKRFDRALGAYRERRHEAEAVVAGLEPEGPSPVTATAVRAGLAGLGLLPGAGPFVGAVDSAQLAQYADRLRRGLSARFTSQDDVQLVLSPEQVLTPKLLDELAGVAAAVPWIVLFFDTYERIGPFVDAWLYEAMTSDRHGALPANVVVVTAGQRPFDRARWGGFADFMTELPLGPFSEEETRGLLADRGVVAEPVVADVLRLTGGLPLLVSTLAEQRPADPDDIGDPSATAVERFLKWEQDPARRAVALACALPRRLDLDVFRAAVDRPDDEADALFGWLRGLSFVDDRGDRLRYHDLVREQMLRLSLRRSSRDWTQRHTALAAVFARWREEAADGIRADEVWEHGAWRDLRLEETYHLLCARPRAMLPEALTDLVAACREDAAVGSRWARMLEEAGEAAAAPDLQDGGRRLREALTQEPAGVLRAMDLLLALPGGLDVRGRAMAHAVRGRERRNAGEHDRALAEYDEALDLDPELVVAHYGRGHTHLLRGDFTAALAALDRADELAPDTQWILAERGDTYRRAGRFAEAVPDLDRAIALDPTDVHSLIARGLSHHALDQDDEALADFNRVLSLNERDERALVWRGWAHFATGEEDRCLADMERAVVLAPDSAWVAEERADLYRKAGRLEESFAEFTRALALAPDSGTALAGRAMVAQALNRHTQALADLDRALELDPGDAFLRARRARARHELGDERGMAEDLRRAGETRTDVGTVLGEVGRTYWLAGRHEEALAAYSRALDADPDDTYALGGIGACHRDLRNYTEAFRHLDLALAADPRNGWALIERARAALAVGRTERALTDLDRCVTLGVGAGWSRAGAIELLMRCGRWPEALDRLAEADRLALPEEDLADCRAEAYRHTGQWPAAREEAERMRTRDPLHGTINLALAVGGSHGLRAARPLWREAERRIDIDVHDATARAFYQCLADSALGRWPSVDASLADLMEVQADWDDLATLSAVLTELLRSPDADRARLAPRLTAVTAARDATQARYAE